MNYRAIVLYLYLKTNNLLQIVIFRNWYLKDRTKSIMREFENER